MSLLLLEEKCCLECEEPINPKRVEALPHTEHCIDCARSQEVSGAFQRHVMDVQPQMKCGEVDAIVSTICRGS